MKPQRKGHISNEKTVWCGKCYTWWQQDDYKFTSNIRKIGWKLTRKDGWLCPECSQGE